jgi:transcriptional regulator with XRE-family HTH domain
MRQTSESFGRRLAQIRKHRHLTQQQLGAAVGKSERTISDWENSQSVEIWIGDVAQCARALRCQVKDLLAPVDEPIPPYPLLWPKIRRRFAAALSGGGPLRAEVARARIAKLWEERCRLANQRDFLPPQERAAVDKRLKEIAAEIG